jgi:hypothetical protein
VFYNYHEVRFFRQRDAISQDRLHVTVQVQPASRPETIDKLQLTR